jgi:hypothetical protein
MITNKFKNKYGSVLKFQLPAGKLPEKMPNVNMLELTRPKGLVGNLGQQPIKGVDIKPVNTPTPSTNPSGLASLAGNIASGSGLAGMAGQLLSSVVPTDLINQKQNGLEKNISAGIKMGAEQGLNALVPGLGSVAAPVLGIAADGVTNLGGAALNILGGGSLSDGFAKLTGQDSKFDKEEKLKKNQAAMQQELDNQQKANFAQYASQMARRGMKVELPCDIDSDGIDTDVLKELHPTQIKIIQHSIGDRRNNGVFDEETNQLLKHKALEQRLRLIDYLKEKIHPQVSKKIIMLVEKHLQGGLIKYQKGNEFKSDVNEVKKQKRLEELQRQYTQLTNRPKLNDTEAYLLELIDEERESLINGVPLKPSKNFNNFDKIKEDEHKYIPKEYYREKKHPKLFGIWKNGTKLTTNSDLSNRLNKKLNKKLENCQTGSILNYNPLLKPSLELQRSMNKVKKLRHQEGGEQEVPQEQPDPAFMQWLAQKLGVRSQEEFDAKLKSLQPEQLEQAKQMYQQESQNQSEEAGSNSPSTGYQQFKHGGQIVYDLSGKTNKIVDGVLHARNNNIPKELDLGRKGVPVVAYVNEGIPEKHSEIEVDELIIHKEIADKVEKMAYDFLNNKKDIKAIELGKLFTQQLLNNTIDNKNKVIKKA